MRAYMAWSGVMPEDGAVLVFAHTAQEARRTAWPILESLYSGEWIYVRARWLRDVPWLIQQADEERWFGGVAHVIESPEACKCCGLWGDELEDGLCEDCASGDFEW